MVRRYKRVARPAPATHQGSWAQFAQAEKVLLSMSAWCKFVQRRPLVQPAIFEVGRLKPAWIQAFPTSQPRQPTCAPARTRVYVRDGWFSAKSFSIELQNRLGKLGGWETQHPCGFQPSNLIANLKRVGQKAAGEAYG